MPAVQMTSASHVDVSFGGRARSVVVALLSIGMLGCEPSANRRTPVASPLAVAHRLVAARQAGDLVALQKLVLPERAAEVARALVAMDDLIRANQQLCSFLRREVRAGLAEVVDQSHLATRLGIFSRDVRLLEARPIDADTVDVTFTVGDRLPAERARFALLDSAWRYDPVDPQPPLFVEGVRALTAALRSLHDDLESGALSRAAVRRDPNIFIAEAQERLSDAAARLPTRAPSP